MDSKNKLLGGGTFCNSSRKIYSKLQKKLEAQLQCLNFMFCLGINLTIYNILIIFTNYHQQHTDLKMFLQIIGNIEVKYSFGVK